MHERTVFPQFVTAALSLPRIGSYSAYDLAIIPFDAFFCAKKVDCCSAMKSCLRSVMRPAIGVSTKPSVSTMLQIVKLCALREMLPCPLEEIVHYVVCVSTIISGGLPTFPDKEEVRVPFLHPAGPSPSFRLPSRKN